MKNPFEQYVLDLIQNVKQEIDIDIYFIDDLNRNNSGQYIVPENSISFDLSFDDDHCKVFIYGPNIETNKKLHTYLKKMKHKVIWTKYQRFSTLTLEKKKITIKQYNESLKICTEYKKQIVDDFKISKDPQLLIDWMFIELKEKDPELTQEEFDEVFNMWKNIKLKEIQIEEFKNEKY
jgi:hypothetical protein